MVEFGKLLLTHHPSFSITIFVSTAPITTAASAKLVTDSNTQLTTYVESVSATNPSFNFHHLPTLPPKPDLDPPNVAFEITRLHMPNIREALQTLAQTTNFKAFIIDMFCDAAFDVARDLNIPIFYFYTSAANTLAVLLNLPAIHRNKSTDFPDLPISISGMPQFPVSALPTSIFDRNTRIYKSFIDIGAHIAQSDGIVVNTFELLESKAVKALRDGKCLPNQPTPPIFCTGPLIYPNNQARDKHACLCWLDAQPKQSVVFLCFGSMGVLSTEQLVAMAEGLERSGHRFLWVVRNPTQNDQSERSLDEILPNGFLERTKDRGLVVWKWAPQMEVLSHDSVGGFVTHCGWNSVLEWLSAGVPMAGWPLYAEQKMTRVFLVEAMRVAVAVMESESGFVSAEEFEKRVSELMDSESERGWEVRKRATEFKNGGVAAKEEGGSSVADLAELAELWKKT